MKKVFTMFICLLCLLCLVGCSKKEPEIPEDPIEIEFRINDKSYFETLDKGSIVNTDTIPLNNNSSYALYYDENYEIIYNEEQLFSNTVLYLKEINGSLQIGDFYTLSSAYENGYLSIEDIKSIKDKYANQSSIEKIGENKLNIIKNDYLYDVNEYLDLEVGELNIDDISLIKFYGIYNGYYIVRLLEEKTNNSTVLSKVNIEDIVFEYSGPDIIVWTEHQEEFPNIFFYQQAVKYYDTSEEKRPWNGLNSENIIGDCILVVFKKTYNYTYPELSLECFGLKKATHIDYSGGTPPEFFFRPEYSEYLERYRQSITIYIEPMSIEEVIDCVNKLQRLEFVRSANPNKYVTVD